MGKKLNKTVFVGVSGGVDSSVSAALLKDQGYNVVGVFIRTWQPDFIECTWRDERRDAMRVCAHLDIPFLECDGEEAYKNGVADYMIEEYKKGNTPNPDVMCNREVKFGIFWDFAKKHSADYIATGHYAQVVESKNRKEKLFKLKQSPDKSKDQSYFLWTLNQEDLAHTLFPVGHLNKKDVRKLAEKYKLPTAVKKDSQGVCFLGPLDMKDFLKHYIKEKNGDVLDDKGEVIGHHDGALFFTLGERHGFTITKKGDNNKPLYVIAKDVNNNTITVSQNKILADKGTDNSLLGISNLLLASQQQFRLSNETDRMRSSSHSITRASRTAQGLSQQEFCFALKNINWISEIPINPSRKYTAQIRYHGEQIPCTIKDSTIIFTKPVLVSPGQSMVVYDHDVCLGGGVVL